MKSQTLLIIGAVVAIAIGLSLWGRPASTPVTTREAAFTCVSHGSVISYHVHPTLRIVIEGKEEAIPANIGVSANCMRALHTHDATGKLHIEYPQELDFTLGDFFAVWEQPFTREQILDYRADETRRIRMTFNGSEVDTFENTVIRDKDEIVIYYEAK